MTYMERLLKEQLSQLSAMIAELSAQREGARHMGDLEQAKIYRKLFEDAMTLKQSYIDEVNKFDFADEGEN